MPPAKTQEELETLVDAALAQRLRGNEFFKKGELTDAMREYHGVLTVLRGLDSAQQMFPMVPVPAAAPISTPPKPQPPKFEEIADDVKDEPKPDANDEADAVKEQDPVGASDNKSESDSATVKPDVEPEPEVAVPTPQERAKAALLLTYLNMAAVMIKLGKHKRGLDYSHDALKMDENNAKAKFREAQARIGMGQLSMGKALLEELQKKSPDAAIKRELEQLAAQDKAGEAKKLAAFRGMYARKPVATLPPATVAAGKAATAST